MARQHVYSVSDGSSLNLFPIKVESGNRLFLRKNGSGLPEWKIRLSFNPNPAGCSGKHPIPGLLAPRVRVVYNTPRRENPVPKSRKGISNFPQGGPTSGRNQALFFPLDPGEPMLRGFESKFWAAQRLGIGRYPRFHEVHEE
jgi:hypothetical protein